MAYIPPHKRHSRESEKPSPKPEYLIPKFTRNLNLSPSVPRIIQKRDLKPPGSNVDRSGKIVYADQAINKWFSIGCSNDGNRFPSSVHLEPFPVTSIVSGRKVKPLALMNTNISQGNREEEEEVVTKPWVTIVVNLLRDLLSSVKYIKNEINQDEDVKPKFVARVGKILFHGISESDRHDLLTDKTLRYMIMNRRSFYTNVSDTYMENIRDKVIPLIGVEFEEEKDIYSVQLSDSERPSVTLSCKCSAVPESNNIELYKIELNKVRHMVADISCLKQNMDMRLILVSKKTVEKMTDDEMESIVALIKSAVLDQEYAKGVLRWPQGIVSSEHRFRVVGVWHTVAKSYVNPFVRLQLRNADRYDFITSVREVSNEVTFKLKQVTSELLREKADFDVISDMLHDNLELFWNHFVCSASCLSPFRFSDM